MILIASNSTFFKMSSTTMDTCVKLRGFFCVSVMDISICFLESRCRIAFPFSPIITYFDSFSGPDSILNSALLIFTEVELIPPQRPLSEVTVTRTFFFTSRPGTSPSNAVKGCHNPLEFSALVWTALNFDAATIFIAFVIFWILFTLFILFLTT
eukprot:Gb_15891 [translate_table: standard]